MMQALALLLVLAAQTPAPPPAQGADSSVAGGTVQLVAETPIDRQIREIAEQLRCPVCQSQSILESNSALALEMRGLIRERLEAGESPDQIKEYFVGRYGEWILLDPKAEGFNLAVYILPVVAVLVGIVILVFAARRWMRPPGEAAAQPDEDPDLAAWEDIRST
jgi:cytochrome c-type biogenesis protein CcmH/NrfF